MPGHFVPPPPPSRGLVDRSDSSGNLGHATIDVPSSQPAMSSASAVTRCLSYQKLQMLVNKYL
jgi:hypothetical protein